MISEEGKVWPFASRGVELDVQPAIIETLRAALDLGHAYGIGYFNMFLRGVENTDWVKRGHMTLPAFGSLKGLSRDEISRIFHFMVDEGYLEKTNDGYSSFGITDKGRRYLEKPETRTLHPSYLKVSAKESYLYKKLRGFRKELAERLSIPEYSVFTDFTLDRIVMRMPMKSEQLLSIPGMNAFRLDMFGANLLALLGESLEEYRVIAQRRQNYFNSKPDHQYVKRLVEENRPFAEISKAMTYEFTKVENILFDLALTNEANIPAWVEAQVNPKALFKATEHFRKAKNRSIGTARETLGMDVAALHMSRLYVKVMDQAQPEMKKAS